VEAVVSTAAREGGPDFYRRLSEASARDLAAMIEQAAAEPASTDRELALAVLLKRYSELDALGAVRLAREARVGGMALSAVYGAWARVAPAQALAALGTVESPDAAADVGFALIASLGNDAAAVGRVAAVLVARDGETPFETGPTMSPVGPFGPPSRSALALMAERFAALDARHAFAVARELDDQRVRMTIEAAALRALARSAPEEAFGHLAALGSELTQPGVLGGAITDLARADPARLLSAANGLPTELRRMAESTALRQLAERDPLAALLYLERMPAGVERQMLTQAIARSYGMHDPAAALAWARAQPGAQNLVGAVIGGIAEHDPNRAVDLALELRSPMERMQAIQFAAMTGARQDSTAEAIANRLLAIDDSSVQNALAYGVIANWASRSPDGAMNWLLANGQRTDPNTFMQVGQHVAMRDPRAAVAYTAQVPSAAREPWIRGVAQGYAQNDPQGAIDWLGQFRGEQWYDRAATTVAMHVAQRDGAAAARIFEGLDPARIGPEGEQLANVIASNWANHDPAAAAEWAIERSSELGRAMAVQSVLGVWTHQDADGARQWTLQLPQGALRDRALTMLLTAAAQDASSALDGRVLNAFGSEAARQQAVLQVVQTLAYADATRARTIADTHLTEPAFRAQADRMIEAARNAQQRGGIGFGVNQAVTRPPVLRPR
jgi:hypothetical protein